jgi:hypothetical protein
LGKLKGCETATRALTDIVPQLTDVVPGRYVFSLRVTDEQGETAEDAVSIFVKHGKWYKKLFKEEYAVVHILKLFTCAIFNQYVYLILILFSCSVSAFRLDEFPTFGFSPVLGKCCDQV